MGSSKKTTVGYHYYMGMHMGQCRGPVDSLIEIKVGDRVAWQGKQAESGQIMIDAPELFGGKGGEGGVRGPLDVMMGEAEQAVNAQLDAMLTTPTPAFRHRLTTFFDGLVSSINPYPKPWSWRVRRALKGWIDDEPWYPEKAIITDAPGFQFVNSQEIPVTVFRTSNAVYRNDSGIHVWEVEDPITTTPTIRRWVVTRNEPALLVDEFEITTGSLTPPNQQAATARGIADVNLLAMPVYTEKSDQYYYFRMALIDPGHGKINSPVIGRAWIPYGQHYVSFQDYCYVLWFRNPDGWPSIARFAVDGTGSMVTHDVAIDPGWDSQTQSFGVVNNELVLMHETRYSGNLQWIFQTFNLDTLEPIATYIVNSTLNISSAHWYTVEIGINELFYRSTNSSLRRRVILDGDDEIIGQDTVLFPQNISANQQHYSVFQDQSGFRIFYSNHVDSECSISNYIIDEGSIHAMNPAHIVYQTLTDPDWGQGLPASAIDDDAFRFAADVLYSEGFGLCVAWRRQVQVKEFLADVLHHCGGNLYPDLRTGKLALDLERDDYTVEALPSFDFSSGLLGIDEDESSSIPNSTNEVIVVYRDPVSNEDRQVRVQNLASINSTGTIRSETINFPGIPTPELALRVGQRELTARSTGLKRFVVRLDRRGYELRPGSVFVISAPDKGIESIVLRTGKIRSGSIARGTIELEAVQDVFGLPATTYIEPQSTSYVAPDTRPIPISVRRAMEAPYRDVAANLPSPQVEALEAESGIFMTLGVKPSSVSLNYRLDTRVGSAAFAEADVGEFCPTAVLDGDVPQQETPTEISVDVATILGGQHIAVGQTALINDEVVRVDSVDLLTGVILLGRGCVDTVPAAHSSGDRVWFYGGGDFAAIDPTEYQTGLTVVGRLLTTTSTSILPEESAGSSELVMAQRQARPYPPGKAELNSQAYPGDINGDGITITWAHRDRLLQDDQVIDTSQGDIGPEAGTTYTVRSYDGEILATEVDGIAGTSYVYGKAETIADGYIQTLTIEIASERDSLESWQAHNITVERYGLGFHLGDVLGGGVP